MKIAVSSRTGLAASGGVLISLIVAGLSIHLPGSLSVGSDSRTALFVLLACVSGAVYLGAVVLVQRQEFPRAAVWWILGAAAVMRVLVLAAPPFLSSDLYRYVWDGRVQVAGINPFRYIPTAPELEFLRDHAIFPNINRADWAPTIYPPVAQMIFFAVARISASVTAIKLAMVGFETIAIWVVLGLLDRAGLPRARILVYAWNPLAIWEFAGNGHVDAAAMGLIALALFARTRGRMGMAGAVLGAATLVKFLPLVLFPALWRRWDARMPLAFLAVIVCGYLVYAGVGWNVLGFLPGYVSEEGLRSGSGIYYLRLIGQFVEQPSTLAYLAIVALGFAILSLRMIRERASSPPQDEPVLPITGDMLILMTALMVAITPHYPWYFAWLALPACLVCSYSVLYLSVAAFLLYLDPVHTSLLWPGLVYGPFALIAAAEFRHRRPDDRTSLLFRRSTP